MGLSRWKRFWSIDVPGGAIGLVWNGMMSFGGSWFFLTASELIIVGGHRYTLPGVGSYVGVAVEQGRLGHVVWGIITMIIMILAVNFVFWRPLVAYAERFRLEQTEASQKPRSVVLAVLRRSSWPGLAGRGRRAIARPVNQLMAAAAGIDDRSLVSRAGRRRAADIAFAAVIAVVLGYGLYSMLAYIAAGQQGFSVLWHAFGLGFLTFLRVAVVVAGASVIWVPVGVWIGFNPRIAQYLQPVVQVFSLMSICISRQARLDRQAEVLKVRTRPLGCLTRGLDGRTAPSVSTWATRPAAVPPPRCSRRPRAADRAGRTWS